MSKENKNSIEFLRENQSWSDSECNILIRCAIENCEWLDVISKRHLRSPHSLRNKLIEYGQIEDDEDCNDDFADIIRPWPARETDKEMRERWDQELPDSCIPKKPYSELETPSMHNDDWDNFDSFDNYDWEHYLGGPGES